MATKRELEIILGQIIADLMHEQRLHGLSKVIDEMIAAINHYDRKP